MIQRHPTTSLLMAAKASSRSRRRTRAGQAMVETVIVISVILLILFGAIQLALIFNAALAVSEYSYTTARYAAVHGTGSTCSAAGYGATLKSSVSPPPTICSSGFSGCSGSATPLSIASVSCTTSAGSSDGTINQGDQITVQISYNLTTGNKIFFPSNFLGFRMGFPTSLSNSSSVMAE
jgi:TadE-like protein